MIGGGGILFTPCLKHSEISSPYFQESHETPFPLVSLSTPTTPSSLGKVRKWALCCGTCALTSRVNRPAAFQTGCWLTWPSGRQHVWHHATWHIWQRWGLNNVCFSLSSHRLYPLFQLPFSFKRKKKIGLITSLIQKRPSLRDVQGDVHFLKDKHEYL